MSAANAPVFQTGMPVEVLSHQARVIQERIRVSGDVNKLEAFITGEKFRQIPVHEQELLTAQLEYMALYLGVLHKRVMLIIGTKEYQCHKTVHARAMTRGDYNALRGWDTPPNERPLDQGYLVEYLDGGEPNHPDFAGYISWSPKDVFERGYSEIK